VRACVRTCVRAYLTVCECVSVGTRKRERGGGRREEAQEGGKAGRKMGGRESIIVCQTYISKFTFFF